MRRLLIVWLGAGCAAVGSACSSSSAKAIAGSDGGGSVVDSAGIVDGTIPPRPDTGGASADSAAAMEGGALPEGSSGIAAAHPGDNGIASDPDVVFADDFESYAQASDLWNRWDNVYQMQYVAITTDPTNVFAGKQALEFTLPVQTAELANATDKVLSPERDTLFLRYYSKFQSPFDVTGSSHNGSAISAHYYMGQTATPGVPANGTNKFLAGFEDWRNDETVTSPGPLNIYIYWPEQRSQYGDHFFASGMVLPNSSIPDDFGPNFVSRPDVTPSMDTWHCYEYMVKANTPGVRDGRIAFWFDGQLAADFQNLRLRDVATLTIDHIDLFFHAGSNPNAEQKKRYDNVVAATSYIGPMK